MTTPTLQLCADLATRVGTLWEPAAPDLVDWDFSRHYTGPDALGKVPDTGRQVIFFPATYEWETATRANEDYTHHLLCRVVERYADAAGDPPRAWTTDRVDFVHDTIVKGTRFTRSGPPSFNPNLMTLRGSVQVYDAEKLYSDGKLFYALVEMEFLERVP